MPEGARITTLPRRGDATRERLLDAAETLVADHGFSDPSHRALAGNAGVHVALVNYHFGSKELLFEEALARRASRLADAWHAALAQVRSKPAFTPPKTCWARTGCRSKASSVPKTRRGGTTCAWSREWPMLRTGRRGTIATSAM